MAGGQSRACALLSALGRLYERSHLILAESAELASMHEVFAGLLSPFEWLQPTLLRLAESHHLWDVGAEEVAKALAVVAAMRIPEGVPPTQPYAAAGVQPEPEPEPEPET